jgi:hypothetical protein
LVVRRQVASTFRYDHESEDEWQQAVTERPDGVGVDVNRWGQLDQYDRLDGGLWVYESDTGTQHLIPHGRVHTGSSWHFGVVCGSVFKDLPTPCGTTSVDRHALAEGSAITPYAEHVLDAAAARGIPTSEEAEPPSVLDNPCEACCRALAKDLGTDELSSLYDLDWSAYDFTQDAADYYNS